ncbi:unnamed protein product, partial [Sphacelaria rigidula]
LVEAACPNHCSGHGTCGSGATCTCNDGWDFAPDCSLRTCSKGLAWADKAYSTDTAHSEVECSNAGNCNRQTGICACFTPFTGAACQRVRCPEDCSGHGTCMTIGDLSRFYGPDYVQPGTGGDGIGPSYGNWDVYSTTACFCDQGHFGADCSKRMCPKDDDPVTVNQDDRTIGVSVGTDGGSSISGTLTFTFNGHSTRLSTDFFGSSSADTLCEEAFESLDNVEDAVCYTEPLPNGGLEMNVSFVSFPMVPAENNLFHHTGNPDLSAFTCDVSAVDPSGSVDCNITDLVNTNVKEYEFCGRRGLCDFATGLCECLDGWTGGACSVESYVYSTSNAIPGISLSASGLDYTGNVLEASTEKRAAPDFNFLQFTAENVVVFKVRGDGFIEIEELAIGEGGLSVENGGIQVDDGGLMVSDGGATISNSSASDDILALSATSTGFVGNVISLGAATTSSTSYNHIEAQDDSSVVFSVRGDGQTTIADGDLIITLGDETISAGDLFVSNGSITAKNGTLTIAGITSSAVVTVEDDIHCTGNITAATGLLTIEGITSSATVEVTSGGAQIVGTLTVVSGGAIISAGGLNIQAGGETIDNGDLDILNGNLGVSGTTTSTGLITATAGITSAGDITTTSSGNLLVDGTTTSTGLLTASNNLQVDGTTTSTGLITATAGITSAGDITTTSSGNLLVDGTTTSTGLLTASNNLQVDGTTTSTGLLTASDNLQVDGTTTSTGLITATAGITSAGDITTTSSGNLLVDGTTTSTGLLTASDNLQVDGTTTSTGLITATAGITSAGDITTTS